MVQFRTLSVAIEQTLKLEGSLELVERTNSNMLWTSKGQTILKWSDSRAPVPLRSVSLWLPRQAIEAI